MAMGGYDLNALTNGFPGQMNQQQQQAQLQVSFNFLFLLPLSFPFSRDTRSICSSSSLWIKLYALLESQADS